MFSKWSFNAARSASITNRPPDKEAFIPALQRLFVPSCNNVFFVCLTQDVGPCRRPWSCRCHYYRYYNNYVTHSGAGNRPGTLCLWNLTSVHWNLQDIWFGSIIRLPVFFKTANKDGCMQVAVIECNMKFWHDSFWKLQALKCHWKN